MANKPKRISEGQYLLLEYIKNFGHLEIVQRSLLEGFECRLHELEYSAFTEKETYRYPRLWRRREVPL
jgi:hypothetical protein